MENIVLNYEINLVKNNHHKDYYTPFYKNLLNDEVTKFKKEKSKCDIDIIYFKISSIIFK